MLTKHPFFPAARPVNAAKRGYSTGIGFNDLWGSTGFSQMGRAGVHRPIYQIVSAQAPSQPRAGRGRVHIKRCPIINTNSTLLA